MAVYTHLSADDLAELMACYDVGDLVSAKGIAEGISNSNWLVETTGSKDAGARFILTMYERRIAIADLPFFLGLLDHLAAKGLPVPRTIHDRDGAGFRMLGDKAVALIEFLPGISVEVPTIAQARAVGVALAEMHLASTDYGLTRTNELRPADWAHIVSQAGDDAIAAIDPALPRIIQGSLAQVVDAWPEHLPRSIIHADLFPDNVLIIGPRVEALIDFYFACEDISAYDLAVTHVAWSFADQGRTFRPDTGAAILEGYRSVRGLSRDEIEALPLLAQGAAMRFVCTRIQDWLDTPAGALVTRKDPMDFARRLEFYQREGKRVFDL